MSQTTNLPNGVTNADSNSSMGTLTQLDPTKVHTYFNDFNLYKAADWVVTTIGTSTQTIGDEAGGVLDASNSNAIIGNSNFLQLKNETFKFVRGKRLHFKVRMTMSITQQSLTIMGLQIRDTTPMSVSDGVYFLSAAGSNDINFHVRKDNIDSTIVATTLPSAVNDIFYELAFVYDGDSEITAWFNDVKVGTLDVDNLPDDEELTISFGSENAMATAVVLSIDYIYIASER